ncbi:hypothetical protein V2Z46_004470 [Salmonella enterica]|uniref:hypothetical protein n=1 Tax=Salmonella enterica TaxID=28901 RepID=UPI000F97BCB3|nr:hypothetical protein [Salmonella enterica]ECC3531412.1 hypothetical protein [Salmonella enterica subsp. enterica serovar Javiana]ECS6035093.1 hypothetical protein [Salmonella enterica subsp. enterica serovar Panama]EDD0254553.1 hypothetical protein [Salmonella enterica subsp. enterica serovar Muenchen]EDV6639415.1 hypothetical protein [Salmonella enterica subsp. enterica serovar Saintpaul]EEO7713281.1 hypothetical protein [Salmonella enterica subsp. enterica serovar Newport]
MKQMTLIEMDGFLKGKCIPRDLKVNETNAEYLVRKFAEAEAKCAALAAENAKLKKFCKDAAFDADYEAELGMERGGFSDALNEIKTPATDAFLAEVRAQGVEMFSEKFGGGTLISDMVKEVAKDFAAQLRKGVQS